VLLVYTNFLRKEHVMKEGQSEVKSKGKVVGTAKFDIFDSVDEAVETIGQDLVLELVNAQTKTRSLNIIREGAQERLGKKALTSKAMATITPEEFMEVAGDPVRIRQLLEAKEVQLKAELLAASEAPAEAV